MLLPPLYRNPLLFIIYIDIKLAFCHIRFQSIPPLMPFTLNWRCTILWPKKKKIHITSYYINSCSRQKLKWRPHGRGMGLVKEFQWPELICLFSNLITAVQWCGFWVGVMGTSGFKVVIYCWDDQNFKRSGNIEKREDFFHF